MPHDAILRKIFMLLRIELGRNPSVSEVMERIKERNANG